MIGFNQKLKTTDCRDYWVTSDLHFYHKNIMKFCSNTRPYDSIEEMHESIIADWNSKVKPNDVIFHLGDFSFAAKDKTQVILDQLNGNIVWICGNHDLKVFNQLGIDYHHYFELRYDGVKVVMCHFPIAAWNQQGRGSVHLHGHTHGSYSPEGRAIDAGWDNLGSIQKLSDVIMSTYSKEIYTPDQHKVVEE